MPSSSAVQQDHSSLDRPPHHIQPKLLPVRHITRSTMRAQPMRPNNISRPIHIAPKKMDYHNSNSIKRAPSTESVLTPSCYTINHFYPGCTEKTPMPEVAPKIPSVNCYDALPYMRIRQGNTPQDCHIVMDPKNIGLFMPWINANQSRVTPANQETGRLSLTQSNLFPYHAFKAFDRSLLTLPSQFVDQQETKSSQFVDQQETKSSQLVNQQETKSSSPAWIVVNGGDNAPSNHSMRFLNGKSSTDFVKSLHCAMVAGSDHLHKELTIQFASLTYHANGSPVLNEQGEPIVKNWLHMRIDIALAMLDFFFSQPLSMQYLEDVGLVDKHTWSWDESWYRVGSTRGDLLGDYSYIESLELHQSSSSEGLTSHQCVVQLTTIEATPAYIEMVKRRDAASSPASTADEQQQQNGYSDTYFDDNDFSHVCDAMDTRIDLDLLEF